MAKREEESRLGPEADTRGVKMTPRLAVLG